MAKTQTLSGSRAGVGSVVVVDDTPKTFVLTGIGINDASHLLILAPGAVRMDGAADVPFAGRAVTLGAAQMDGQAQVFVTHLTSWTVAHMDGQAQVAISSITVAPGRALMDGQAQVSGVSITTAQGAAQMDGRASEVVMQTVVGAGLAEMDGAASMLAVAPNVYKENLFDTVIGDQAISLSAAYNRIILQAFVSSQLLKPKLRYHVVFNQTINLSHSISFRMRFPKVIREVAITLTPSLAEHSQFHYTFDDPIYMEPVLTPTWHAILNLAQNFTVAQTMSPSFVWGRALTQALTIVPSLGVHGRYPISLAQLFKLSELDGLKLSHPVALNQNLSLHPSLIGEYALQLLQKLLAGATSSPGFHYHLTLANGVKVGGILEHLISEILTQLFTVHPALSRQFIASGSLSQLLTMHPALNNKLVLQLVGDIQLSPEQLVHMLYAGDPLLDGIEITALYISPSGTTTTWAVNTRTNAVTEYCNYNFNSFALLGNRYIAAGPEGLYELDGDTDDGALIISDLMGGYLQLNEKKLFGIKGAYVAIRGGGRFYLKLLAGDGREYIYELKAQPNLMTTKVKVGKGISTAYMAWELVTEGQDFDLDSIEFIPMTRGRRV